MPDEIVLAPPPSLHSTTHFRSTWVLASLQAVRERGFGAAYLANLPPAHHEAITLGVASQWFPIDLVLAHYRACDGLGLTADQQTAFGRDVALKMQRTILGTAVRVAKNAGVTPWTIFAQFDRFWSRVAIGGAIAVYRLGPKEARAELLQCPVIDVPYFRRATAGVVLGITELFSERAFVHMLPGAKGSRAAFRVQWV